MTTKILGLVIGIALLSDLAVADESGCPSYRAAQQGYQAFGTFHEIIASAWHVAWPAKDYDALLAAGPKFREAFTGIREVKPRFHSAVRLETYQVRLKRFEELVVAYSRAAATGDKEQVHALLPDLHDAFESAAAVLLPVEYPTLSAFRVTLEVIRSQHLPANNTEGLIGSTETLTMKAALLTEASIPEALKDRATDITPALETIRTRTAELQGYCDTGDWAKYRNTVEALYLAVGGFEAAFL